MKPTEAAVRASARRRPNTARNAISVTAAPAMTKGASAGAENTPRPRGYEEYACPRTTTSLDWPSGYSSIEASPWLIHDADVKSCGSVSTERWRTGTETYAAAAAKAMRIAAVRGVIQHAV